MRIAHFNLFAEPKMKHNKQRNVGVLFEILNHAVLEEVSNNNIPRAKKLFSLLKEYFIQPTQISKAYKIYSQFLYSEARHIYSASLFFENLKKEYNKTVNEKKLNLEIGFLLEKLSQVTNKKELMKTAIPNYKTLATFHIKLHEDNQYLTSRERLDLDHNLFEHLLNNKEAKRAKQKRLEFNSHPQKTREEIQTEKLSLAIALNKFDESYDQLLTSEQKDYLVQYYTSSDSRKFKEWVCKKVDTLLDEVEDKSLVVEDVNIRRKIELVTEKLRGIAEQPEVTTSNLKDILLSVEMKDKLKLF